MGFNPQIWKAETNRIMKEKLKGERRFSNTIIDYTKYTKGINAEGYNGPWLGDVTARDMPIADEHFVAMAKNNINFLFNQEKGVPVLIKDIDEIQSNLSLRREYAEKAVEALLDSYDLFNVKVVLDFIHSTHQIKKADSENDVLTDADFKKARKLLNLAGAPAKNRYACLNVDDESELTSITNFVSADKMGKVAIPEGVVGRAYGFWIYLYTDMPLVYADNGDYAEGAGTKKTNIFYHKNVSGWGRQKEFGIKSEPSAGTASDKINTWSNFGGVGHLNKFAVAIRDN